MSKIKIGRSKSLSLFFLPIIISVIGLFFVFEASSVTAFSNYKDSLYFLKLQLIWVGVGIGVMIFFSFFDYRRLYIFAFPFMFITVLLLVFVLIPSIGFQAGGARRWIDLGIVNIQPTELTKLSIIIYLASWFRNREKKRFFSFMMLIGILIFLIMLQPDMGTAIIVFSLSIIIYFLAGNELRYLFMLIPVSLAGFLFLIKISPYRFRRLMAFFDPSLDPLGITYHLNQILISLSNGGLFGQGFGYSRQKYLFLPEAHTDSIFAIIGEEIGFIGAFILICLFLVLIYKIYRITYLTQDRFARLLAAGIFAFFNLQVIINLAGMVNLIPLTGVPLPFISYGGSNILVAFALMGIIISISRKLKTT